MQAPSLKGICSAYFDSQVTMHVNAASSRFLALRTTGVRHDIQKMPTCLHRNC